MKDANAVSADPVSEDRFPEDRVPDTLVVSEIFGPTFQGEGPSAGERAGFVRLGRCNLTCAWCDTPYTWDWDRFDPTIELSHRRVGEILACVDTMAVGRVVVTGGEPLLQQRRLLALLDEFRERGLVVEVETNATIVPMPELVALVDRLNVSPKLTNSGVPTGRRLVPEALEALRASGKSIFKFVVEGPADLEEVQVLVDDFGLHPIWIMPQATTLEGITRGLRDLADAVSARGWNLTSRLHVSLWGDERGR